MASKDSTLPIDPNVKVPEAVKRAAAKAEAHYQPANSAPDVALVPVPVQVQPAPEPALINPNVPAQVQPPEPQSAPPPVPQPAPAPVPAAPAEPLNYEHMYNSMKGRYDASQRTI